MEELEEPINYTGTTAIVGYSLFLALLLWIGFLLGKRFDLYRDYRVTIAETLGGRPTHKGLRIDFKFTVDNVEYHGSQHPTTDGPDKRIGGRYFIKYLPSDPLTNDILWNKPVPDRIKEAPINGWSEIP